MDETNKLDIKDFPSLSSAPETSNILLALQTGAPGKITIALFKTMVKRDIAPSIKDGVWWIGELNTGIEAAGKSPVFRKGTTGIEWKYEDAADDAWTVLVSYDAIKLKYDDLTPAQRADIISLDNMTAAEIARLQQPANDMIAVLTKTNTAVSGSEGIRVQNEQARALQELERTGAEQTRIQNENTRIQNEKDRVALHAQVITATNEAKNQAVQSADEANAAATQARTAAGNVEEVKNQAAQAARDANAAATQATGAAQEANAARDGADTAALAAKEVADHQPYIGDDYYFYKWNLETKAYDKTNIYTKGEGFSIYRSYTSVDLMKADKANVPEGRFVMINTDDVENPDNAQLYLRNSANPDGFDFLVDMSGAVGFTGKTPQFTVGNVTSGIEGSQVSMSISEVGQDEGGNPVYAINLSIPRGDKGKVPVISMGEVATVSPGSPASAELMPDGTQADGTPKYKLNLSLPKGEQGSLAAGDAKDLTVTFVEAGERSNIQSGDTMSVLFGKIRKFFSDLKTVAFTGKFSDLDGKPTTVDGYGITDASKTGHKHGKEDITDFPTSLPASDVYGWAKQPNKPSYSASEVGALNTDHNTSGTAHQDIRDSIVSYLATAKGYADTKIASLIGSAPEILDTLGELAAAILNNQSAVNAINNAISKKLGRTEAEGLYVAIQGYVAFSQGEKNKLAGLSNYDDSALRDKLSYYEGTNSVSSLTGLPISKRLITANLSGATNISLSSAMAVGREIVISIYPSAGFNQPIPTTNGWCSMDGDSLAMSAGKRVEISILCISDGSYVVSSKSE